MPIQGQFNANSMPMPIPIQCNNNAMRCRFDAMAMPFSANSTMRSNRPVAVAARRKLHASRAPCEHYFL
eukprot:9986430-Lingulodinium_polyedra.AAC.1